MHPAAPDVERPRRGLEVEASEAEATLRVLERLEPPRCPRLEGERRDLAVGRAGRTLDDGAHAVEALVRVVDIRLLGREIGMAHADRMGGARCFGNYAGARCASSPS